MFNKVQQSKLIIHFKSFNLQLTLMTNY